MIPAPSPRCPLFQGLTSEQLSRLNSLLRCRIFPAGSNIVNAEQPGEVVYVIQGGSVKIHVEQQDGSDVILAILGPGQIVGELSVLDGLGRSANAVTLERSTMLWMNRAAFQQSLRTMPAMNDNLVRILARLLRLANAQIQSLASLDVYGRVARQILAFAQGSGDTDPSGDVLIPIRLTQSDLAELVGAPRVRVNQVLIDYKERGHISVNPRYHITVYNAPALAQRCG